MRAAALVRSVSVGSRSLSPRISVRTPGSEPGIWIAGLRGQPRWVCRAGASCLLLWVSLPSLRDWGGSFRQADFQLFLPCVPADMAVVAFYQVSVRGARLLSLASFRFSSRWTPLPRTMHFPLSGRARDFHPLDYAHVGRTPKGGRANDDSPSSSYAKVGLLIQIVPMFFGKGIHYLNIRLQLWPFCSKMYTPAGSAGISASLSASSSFTPCRL